MDKQSFSRTFAALEELKADVAALRDAAENVRQSSSKKDEELLETYRKSAAAAVARVEQTIAKIDMVLNENGSSDNND